MEYWKNTNNLQLPNEIWKDIKGYEGLYQVSNLGRVKSLDRITPDNRKIKGRVLCQSITKFGYLKVILSFNNTFKYPRVHQLVANAFLSNSSEYTEINHKNEVRTDNTVDNLEWCTREYNCNYGSHNINVSKAMSKKVKIKSLETGETMNFSSHTECAKFLGCDISTVCSHSKSKKPYLGYIIVRYK